MTDKKEVGGLVSYIMGITSIVFAFFNPFAGVVFGIVGVVQSKKEESELSKRGKKLSIIGIILGIALFIIAAVFIAKYGALTPQGFQ